MTGAMTGERTTPTVGGEATARFVAVSRGVMLQIHAECVGGCSARSTFGASGYGANAQHFLDHRLELYGFERFLEHPPISKREKRLRARR